MNKSQIFEKMLHDIRLLFKAKRKLSYISGVNELTSLAIDDTSGAVTAKRNGDQSVTVPFQHFERVADAFAKEEMVNIDALFQGSGNSRAVIETVLAYLPNVGYLPANKAPNTGPKKLAWFSNAVNQLGQVLDASGLMSNRKNTGGNSNQIGSLVSLSMDFADAATRCDLKMSLEVCCRFLASILTKRFCILTGLAGSGKTKLAEAFAMWLSASTDQYRVVAVGADWTSNENLLGYADALHAGIYRMPANGALDLILKADSDPANPYFLILDEMNLSHVERYFADVLSSLESANALISLHGHSVSLPTEAGGPERVPASMNLPANLFIIGTVNVDETTYMFSPKVLDRANVIEFRATSEQMGAFLDSPLPVRLDELAGKGVAFAKSFVTRAKARADLSGLTDSDGALCAEKLKLALMEAFAALSDIGAEFGFRAASEMARFVVIHRELSGADWKFSDALDAQVLQKLLPKLHGSARKLVPVLSELDKFAEEHALPLTREKIARMQKRLQRDGFTSFAEN